MICLCTRTKSITCTQDIIAVAIRFGFNSVSFTVYVYIGFNVGLGKDGYNFQGLVCAVDLVVEEGFIWEISHH